MAALPAERDVPAGTPAAGSAPAVQSQTVLDNAGDIHVSAETARRLACDAAVVGMQHGPGGEILDVGRRRRTIPPALRRALAVRDGQCRFPGCQNQRTDAHHARHWANVGETALDNLVLLCRRHHRAVHEEGFGIMLDATREAQFTRPDGRTAGRSRRPPAAAVHGCGASAGGGVARSGRRRDRRASGPASREGRAVDIDLAVGLLWQPSLRTPTADAES